MERAGLHAMQIRQYTGHSLSDVATILERYSTKDNEVAAGAATRLETYRGRKRTGN